MTGPTAATSTAATPALTEASGGAGWARLIPSKRVIGWTLLIAVSAFFLITAVMPYLTWSEEAYRRFWVRAPWLVAHLVGGSIALAFGPWQFWTALRKPSRSVHRWSGRAYVAGVLLAGASGVYLGFYTKPVAFGAALLALDAAWLTTTIMGYLAARNRRFAQHRDWMIRSYVLTIAFVSFRFWLLLALSLGLGDPALVVPVVGWASWIVPLLAVEVLLRRRAKEPTTQTGVRLRPQ